MPNDVPPQPAATPCQALFDRVARVYPDAPVRRIPDPDRVLVRSDGGKCPQCASGGYEGLVLFGVDHDWILCVVYECGWILKPIG